MEEFSGIEKLEQLLEDDGKAFEALLQKSARRGIEAYKEKSEVSFKEMRAALEKM